VVILFDGEDDCPKELAARVREWAQAAAGDTPCDVVIAYANMKRGFWRHLNLCEEAMAFALMHGPENPESRRDAKGALEDFMPADAPILKPATSRHECGLRYGAGHRRNRSFRKLVKAVGDLLTQLASPCPPGLPPMVSDRGIQT